MLCLKKSPKQKLGKFTAGQNKELHHPKAYMVKEITFLYVEKKGST